MLFPSLRSLSRSLLHNPAYIKPTAQLLRTRSFSQTRTLRASEDVETFAARYQDTALFKKLADKPEALAALNDFARMLKDEGIDITSGQPPSRAQMFKLAMSSRFRDVAKKVVVELQNAGIDKEAMEELTDFSRWSKK